MVKTFCWRMVPLAAAFAFAAACSHAAEEYSPLVPAAFSPVTFGEDGTPLRRVSSVDPSPEPLELPDLGQNVVRLSLPLPPKNPESRLRMMDAAPAGPDGALRFTPAESMPGTLHASIPGLVPPEVLVMSRMRRGSAGGARSEGRGFVPISLPATLGTEELMEFDPNAVQEAFPAASRGSGALFAGWPFEDNDALRPPSLPVRREALSLRPGLSGAREMPPLPELPVGVVSLRGLKPGVSVEALPPAEPEAGRETLSGSLRPELVSPPALLEHALSFSDHQMDVSGQPGSASGGFLLPVPPMEAMSPGMGVAAPGAGLEDALFSDGLSLRSEGPGGWTPGLEPEPASAPIASGDSRTGSLRGEGKAERPASRRRRPAKLKGVPSPARPNGFSPMRGVRVY